MPTIQKIFWKDVSNKVKKVNLPLAKIIDEIDPDSRYPLYVARYPYGSTIVDAGKFYVPTENGVVPITDSNVESSIRNDLTYGGIGIPAGVVIEHTTHEAVANCDQSLPLGIVTPGSIFALWKKLDNEPSFHPINMFTITAGARFIFMVPNISNILSHKNLKRDFNVHQPAPRNLLDQWEIFKTIIRYSKKESDWETELMFFSKSWFEKIKSDRAWQSLNVFMLESVWKKSGYERNIIFYNLAFSRAQANRNLKPNPYLVDTAKHLFMTAAGVLPGFAPATDDICAPNTLIQKAYVESYNLEYTPTIFLPKHYSFQNPQKFVYYSMLFPTTLEFSPKSRKITSTMSDLSELKHVTNTFLDEIRNNKLKIENTILGNIANMISFEFFHSKPDRHKEIQPTFEMIDRDPDLLFCSNNSRIKKFADSGALIRGCIRIGSRTNDKEIVL